MTEAVLETRPSAGTGYEGQTFLVGDDVYLRTIVRDDAKVAASWRGTVFPKSSETIKKWIEEDLPKMGSGQRGMQAIVRKSDDRIIGSFTYRFESTCVRIWPHLDPEFGAEGQRWLAEGILLSVKWLVEERFNPAATLELPGNLATTIDLIKDGGMVETARWREMMQINGERVDKVMLTYFSKGWMNRLGDPMDTQLETSGSGEVRPVPVHDTAFENPPKQAVIVGQRIYLRPEDKKDGANHANAMRKEDEDFWDIGRHLTTETQWTAFSNGEADKDYPTSIWFSVCLRENDQAIGSVGVMLLDEVNMSAETGSFFYDKEYRGNGYGFEAKHLLLEYLFEILGLHMVSSYVYFPNTRSAAALRKQGYTEAGRYCWSYPYKGGFGNMVLFDLLADEWRALPRES